MSQPHDRTLMRLEQQHCLHNDMCWIHMHGLVFFTRVGANPAEKKIGQNLKINLSFQKKYLKTKDDLKNTLDYGNVYLFLEKKILELSEACLLEFVVEQILNDLSVQFEEISRARIVIEKGYVPIDSFAGKLSIEAERVYCSTQYR